MKVTDFQFYFKTTSKGQKYGHFLFNCTQIPLIVLEDLIAESTYTAGQEKENNFFLANEEMGAATVDSPKLKIQRSTRRLLE